MDLEQIRREINVIDQQMTALFERRMAMVKEVAQYKSAHNLPVLDAAREEQVIARNLDRITDDQHRVFYEAFLRDTMKVSRHYQHLLMSEKADCRVIPCVLRDTYYNIIVNRGCLREARKWMNLERKVCIVTDDGVPSQYAAAVASQCKESHIVILPQGERNKTVDHVKYVCKQMLEQGFTRSDCVVAVGGGVVGDLAGYAAASYMRGVDFYNIPTTLLSQVDSSIGGKTAVDLDGVKNIIGAFYQPKAVLIDPDVLSTLEPRQFANGLAEVIKMSLTFDAQLFHILETLPIRENIEEIITRSLLIKRDVVQKDEKESALRKVLNFGHTIGHGIETVGEGRWLHGECVAMGMLYFCSPSVKERLLQVLKKVDLPIFNEYDPLQVADVVCHDKKFENTTVSVIAVEEIGSYMVRRMDMDELTTLLKKG